MYEHATRKNVPIRLGASLGLMWTAAFDKQDGALQRCYVIGPVFTTDISMNVIEQGLRDSEQLDLSVHWKSEFMNTLDKLPVISIAIFTQYSLMLHYCVTGEKLKVSAFALQDTAGALSEDQWLHKRDRHKTWMAEQALLSMVREGDLNFKSALDGASTVSSGVPVSAQDPIRQAGISGIVFTSLCTRAAIEGGLSPEQAYSLGDAYIQNIEDSKTITETASIIYAMYIDFIERVHMLHTNPDISKEIQVCCDYIQLHVEDKMGIKDLAERIGYTEYYLSRKFKAEVGVTVNDYIKYVKIERAKLLLTTSDLSIIEISDKLNFCSRSYFGEAFRKVMGCSPVAYRDQNKKV